MFIDYVDLVARKRSKLSDKMCDKCVADLMKFRESLNNGKEQEERKTPIYADNSMTFIFLKSRENQVNQKITCNVGLDLLYLSNG